MPDDMTPANQNRSFGEMTTNPRREYASGELATVLHELEMEGVPPSLLAELLFEYAVIEMEPDDPITTASAITWVSQLTRFRDRLQSKLEAIERVYSEEPC